MVYYTQDLPRTQALKDKSLDTCTRLRECIVQFMKLHPETQQLVDLDCRISTIFKEIKQMQITTDYLVKIDSINEEVEKVLTAFEELVSSIENTNSRFAIIDLNE